MFVLVKNATRIEATPQFISTIDRIEKSSEFHRYLFILRIFSILIEFVSGKNRVTYRHESSISII